MIDIHNPETQAKFDAIKRAHERFEAQQAIVASANPFALLEDARDLDEVLQMMLLVRNHQAELTDRERGALKLKKATLEEEHENADGTKFTIKKSGLVPDGFEPGEDVTFEMGKWDTWIDRAKQREHELLKSHSVAAAM